VFGVQQVRGEQVWGFLETALEFLEGCDLSAFGGPVHCAGGYADVVAPLFGGEVDAVDGEAVCYGFYVVQRPSYRAFPVYPTL